MVSTRNNLELRKRETSCRSYKKMTKLPDRCIFGLINPLASLVCDCLEACRKDPTDCILYQPRAVKTTPQKIISKSKSPYRCYKCGDTEEENFRSSLTLCTACQCKLAKEKYAEIRKLKWKVKVQPKITRPCRNCGIQFWKSRERRIINQ